MGKRGPKPQQALTVAPEVGKHQPERPEPLPDMSNRARAMWRRIVADHPADHFKAGDLPLLRDYCEAYDRSVQAQKEIVVYGLMIPTGTGSIKANPACSIKTAAAHTMKALAVALRLCANSRTTPKQAGKKEEPVASKRSGLMFGGRG